MSLLDDLSSAISGAAQAASPSVVGIGARIRGSGVVVGPDRVMTNAHNLRGEEVTVSFADGRSLRGRVAGTDLDGDLAVIDVATEGAPALAWAEGGVIVGSVVFGLAATSGGPARVTVGTVSAVARAFRGPGGRRISGSLEHTAPMAPGSSGGPIVDAAGRLVGLNTHRVGEGFYLARAADASLRERVEALAGGTSVERPRLGIEVALLVGKQTAAERRKALDHVETGKETSLDYDRIFTTLRHVGFNGWVSLVYEGTEENVIAIEKGAAFLRRYLLAQ